MSRLFLFYLSCIIVSFVEVIIIDTIVIINFIIFMYPAVVIIDILQGSFWNKPLKNRELEYLFTEEQVSIQTEREGGRGGRRGGALI
jgi:hypothetical protein